jgi:hypothetical protein
MKYLKKLSKETDTYIIFDDETPIAVGSPIYVEGHERTHVCTGFTPNGDIECDNGLPYQKKACFSIIYSTDSADNSTWYMPLKEVEKFLSKEVKKIELLIPVGDSGKDYVNGEEIKKWMDGYEKGYHQCLKDSIVWDVHVINGKIYSGDFFKQDLIVELTNANNQPTQGSKFEQEIENSNRLFVSLKDFMTVLKYCLAAPAMSIFLILFFLKLYVDLKFRDEVADLIFNGTYPEYRNFLFAIIDKYITHATIIFWLLAAAIYTYLTF